MILQTIHPKFHHYSTMHAPSSPNYHPLDSDAPAVFKYVQTQIYVTG